MASRALAMNFMYLDQETPAGMTEVGGRGGFESATVNSLVHSRFVAAAAAAAPVANASAAPQDSS